jgi:hypothetical protein
VTPHLDTVTLADQCATLSAAEVKCAFISNPTGVAGANRWTVVAFGESRSGLSDAEARSFFAFWRAMLSAAGARGLDQSELRRAHRVHLTRTAHGGWSILTQALYGAPIQDGWTCARDARTSADVLSSAQAQSAADATLRERGYTSVCAWMGGAPGMDANTYVTHALKG